MTTSMKTRMSAIANDDKDEGGDKDEDNDHEYDDDKNDDSETATMKMTTARQQRGRWRQQR